MWRDVTTSVPPCLSVTASAVGLKADHTILGSYLSYRMVRWNKSASFPPWAGCIKGTFVSPPSLSHPTSPSAFTVLSLSLSWCSVICCLFVQVLLISLMFCLLIGCSNEVLEVNSTDPYPYDCVCVCAYIPLLMSVSLVHMDSCLQFTCWGAGIVKHMELVHVQNHTHMHTHPHCLTHTLIDDPVNVVVWNRDPGRSLPSDIHPSTPLTGGLF